MNTNNNLGNGKLTVNDESFTPKALLPKNSEEKVSDKMTEISETEEKQEKKESVLPESDLQHGNIPLAEEKSTENVEVNSEVNNEEESQDEELDENIPIEIDYEFEMVEEEEEPEDEDEEDEQIEELGDEATALLSIEEIIVRLRELAKSEKPQRKEVDAVKAQFYRSLRNEVEKQKSKFIEEGGEEIDFVAQESELYTEGRSLLQKIKEKRLQLRAQEEAEKERNLAKKLAIIDRIKELIEDQGQEDFNKIYREFKELQQQWKDIQLIPQAKANELWRTYQLYVEKFYDLVRINNEFRKYDFKKNYELKTELCEAAERLDEEPDVVSAFHQLQSLHQQWREIGPVARKDREKIWLRFKEASTKINKKYQQHFEEIKEQEKENLKKKTELCEKLEAIDYSKLTNFNDWKKQLNEVLDIQQQWRQIGHVPRKSRTKIYERYHAACNVFFKNKSAFYKSMRQEMEENLQKKIALCERAEALKDSQDWKKTTQEMIEIQKEWKEIGLVPRKHVDSIWKRFITACDHFFEQKRLQTSSRYEKETKNLEEKTRIIEEINNLDPALSLEEALNRLQQLVDEWYKIGYVPYKLKDKVYKDFYEAVDAQFDRLNIDKSDRRVGGFGIHISGVGKSGNINTRNQNLRERERLMRQYERMKNELQTYENNIGFLSISSKRGNSVLEDMNRKVEKIKADLALIARKIEAIDEQL